MLLLFSLFLNFIQIIYYVQVIIIYSVTYLDIEVRMKRIQFSCLVSTHLYAQKYVDT